MKYYFTFLLQVFLISQLLAETITVTTTNDSGAGSLREAFANAVNGDEIRFDASLANRTIVLTSGHLQTTQSITIDGSNAPNLTIDGNNDSRIFRLTWAFDAALGENVPTTVVIKNLKLINGRAKGEDEDGAGGAIYMLPVGQTLTVENCIFENNYSEGEGGGAIYCGNRGTLTIDNCSFVGNIAEPNGNPNSDNVSERGGTISTNGQGTLTVRNSTFRDNRGINGAGINAVDTNLLVENCLFENNDTKYYPEITPSPSGMPRWRAYGFGGALYTDGANRAADNKYQTLRNCRFIGNAASGQGGGVFLFGYKDDVITVEECTFSQNEVISAKYAENGFSLGGGLVISGGGIGSRSGNLPVMEVSVSNSTFDNNRSYDQGGGFWLRVTDNGKAEVTNCTIANNQSVSENVTDLKGLGGGMAVVGTNNNVVLNNLTIARNLASHQGGGIFNSENNTISLSNSIVAYNEARNAGNDWNIRHNTTHSMNSGSHNIQTNEFETSDNFLDKLTPDVQIIDPLLGELANNGGNTQTIALLEGSPAINAGSGCTSTDQAGKAREGTCDLGALEYSENVTVGLKETNELLGLTLYPNPAKNRIVISSDFPLGKVQVLTVKGEVIFEKEVNQQSLEVGVSNWKHGIYLIKTSKGGLKKFIK